MNKCPKTPLTLVYFGVRFDCTKAYMIFQIKSRFSHQSHQRCQKFHIPGDRPNCKISPSMDYLPTGNV